MGENFLIEKGLIMEIRQRRAVIRELVSDIVKVYKAEEEGEFYLPEYFNEDTQVYEFEKLKNPLTIELSIMPDYEIEGHLIDADYFDEEGIIAITILYDPEKKITELYDIVGELNEIITHEIRHIDQHRTKSFEFDPEEMSKAEKDSVLYYTQPHELDAQVYGFTRLAKLRNLPFNEVVDDWFMTHKNIHQMNDDDIKQVVDKIIDYKRQKG